MKVYYDKDADLSLVKGKNVTIIGYGSQGHAHAQNLSDSGVRVTVGLRKGGASWIKAEKAGLKVAEVAEAVKSADIVMMLLPDEQIAAVYKNDVEANMKQGASLAFAHGFNVHYGQVVPRADLDVWMVAPKAPGHTVRATYVAGRAKRQVVKPKLVRVHDVLRKEADMVEDVVHDLGLAVEQLVIKHGKGIIEKQFLQERMANAAIDIYLATTVLSRTTWEIERAGGEDGAKAQVDCARIFIPMAYRRARRSVRALRKNQDARLKAM